MKTSYLFVFTAFMVGHLQPALAAPQGQNAQTGEIVLEQDASKLDPYESVQDKSLEFFGSMLLSLDKLAAGGTDTIPNMSESQSNYLNAVYLHCSNAAGVCQFILDAVLEADVINSRQSKVATCPIMNQFWRTWLKTDMEQRQRYSVKTGYLAATEEFRRKERPRYIKCAETVKEIIAGEESNGAFFGKRYGKESPQRAAIDKTNKLLQDIKTRIPNIFHAVGASR